MIANSVQKQAFGKAIPTVEEGKEKKKVGTDPGIIGKKINKLKFDKGVVKKIVGISYPDENDPTQKYITQYHTKITYLDQEGKKRTKSVYFGAKDGAYYCDLKDENRKLASNSRLQVGTDDVFHKNYWVVNYLNGPTTSREDNFRIIKKNILT